MHEVQAETAHICVEQKIGDKVVTVAVYHVLHDAGVDNAHAHRLQVVLHGEEVSHPPHKLQARQIRKIHAVRMVEGVVRPYIDTDALFTLGNKFQFFM